MMVGLTYDLREDYLAKGFGEEETAEFDRIDTIEAIEGALRGLGHETDRIGNVRALAARLVSGDRWDLVFNVAEGMSGFGREGQVPSLLEAYDIAYTFSDPLVLSLTLHKAMTKRVVRDLGIPTADFFLVEDMSCMERASLPYPLFAKPVGEGTGKGINPSSRITTREGLASVCERLLRAFRQPVLVETFLPGREFTVGITGTGKDAKAVGAMEVILRDHAEAHAYSYWNKQKFEELVEYRPAKDPVAQEATEAALAVYVGLGCRDAGRVDFRVDGKGVPNFVEINPLAGLHPHHSDLPILNTLSGSTYEQLIGDIMRSATVRVLHAIQERRPT